MAMIKLMFSQPHPPFQEPSSSIPFHYNSPFSSGNSAPFHQIPYHQNQVTSTICYKYYYLQHIIIHGLPVKEIITGEQWMLYQSYSISMN